jgi:hypothetical protein
MKQAILLAATVLAAQGHAAEEVICLKEQGNTVERISFTKVSESELENIIGIRQTLGADGLIRTEQLIPRRAARLERLSNGKLGFDLSGYWNALEAALPASPMPASFGVALGDCDRHGEGCSYSIFHCQVQ